MTACAGPGNGEQYGLTVIGPGVTPDASITVPGVHDYDPNNAAMQTSPSQ